MADPDFYETDILAWSEQQAEALRELTRRRDLPNALDLAHVVEEIEDVGQSELNAARSFVRLILRHAAKCLADPETRSVLHWHVEIANWQSELVDRVSPSMRHRIDLDVLWARALRQAELDLLDQESDAEIIVRLRAFRGTSCPVSVDGILADPADPAALVARMKRTPDE